MWAQFAELGLLGLPFAEEYGGFGGGPVEDDDRGGGIWPGPGVGALPRHCRAERRVDPPRWGCGAAGRSPAPDRVRRIADGFRPCGAAVTLRASQRLYHRS